MISVSCLVNGFRLIFGKGVKRLSLGPLLINLLLYILIGYFLYGQFGRFVDWSLGLLPSWASFLVPIMWVLFVVTGLLVMGYSFAIIAMIVCSPFHGLLAEKVAENLGYRKFDEQLTWAVFYRICARSLQRELTKIRYNLPRSLGVLCAIIVLGFIPVINLLAPVVAFAWAAWSMAIQFIDYPADNDQVDFKPMIVKLRHRRATSLTFGALVAFLLSIPFLNLLVISAAVAGATQLWLEKIEPSPKLSELASGL